MDRRDCGRRRAVPVCGQPVGALGRPWPGVRRRRRPGVAGRPDNDLRRRKSAAAGRPRRLEGHRSSGGGHPAVYPDRPWPGHPRRPEESVADLADGSRRYSPALLHESGDLLPLPLCVSVVGRKCRSAGGDVPVERLRPDQGFRRRTFPGRRVPFREAPGTPLPRGMADRRSAALRRRRSLAPVAGASGVSRGGREAGRVVGIRGRGGHDPAPSPARAVGGGRWSSRADPVRLPERTARALRPRDAGRPRLVVPDLPAPDAARAPASRAGRERRPSSAPSLRSGRWRGSRPSPCSPEASPCGRHGSRSGGVGPGCGADLAGCWAQWPPVGC